ncbi:PREDICTED: galanin receptor type 3-like isoform X2 [Wasmannia auropunctata]|uniref:galanin receptor type 3-like isoform X2 n=1 Tax=Wasmannia auropunctata TaxID=64793 RepID=UPI0005F06A0B|nr:PREDICTED: galanin receptor type 3-like isoform X2 [Wasmannia auropunctata]
MGPWAFVPLILVSTLGLLLNGYVLLVVLGLGKQTQQQQTANTLLLIHLGAVEAAVCLILLIFATGLWPEAGPWCVIHGFLLALLHPVALWTVTGLNCDRYYAIAAPLHYAALVSPRRVVVGLAASWTGALLLCLPPFSGLVPPYRYNSELGCCAPDFGNSDFSTWKFAAALYGAAYAILGLGLPAVLVTVCNLRVLGIARYHRHRIASAIYEVTLSAQVTITHQRNPFFVPTVTAPSAGGPPRFHSAASTVMQLIGSLYLLYFPYCGFILWEACGVDNQQRHANSKLASLASLLLACSPPINGLLYGLKSQTLRRSVQNYWRKKATKSELQQEIQARTPSVAGSRRPSGSGNTSFFPFPPLQRRLSEALLALGSCRTGGSFESNNLGFQRGRLQPAVSCNTLRVPTAESERRWRHCSTGSESSTGSSDASVWTTGVVPKYGKGNAKNSDGWSSRTRYVRGKNLEEGALSTTIRPNNNSESSDTTDTTTATTTTTTLLKSLAMETGEENEKEKERMNGNMKKREFSESESSWSSVEEIEIKAEKNDEDDNPERSKEENPQTKPPRRKSKSSNCDPEISEDREEAAQLRPLLTPSS